MAHYLFLLDGTNPEKLSAVQAALRNFPVAYEVKIVTPEKVDERPLSREKLSFVTYLRAQNILNAVTPQQIQHHKNAYSIALQKGTNIKDTTERCKLILEICICKMDSLECIKHDASILLPDKMRKLVLEDEIELYKAYENVFEQVATEKSFSPYEILTEKREVNWMKDLTQLALIPLSKRKLYFDQ